jgi:hypothetical protein
MTPPKKEESIVDPSQVSMISMGELEAHLKKMSIEKPIDQILKPVISPKVNEGGLNFLFGEDKDKSMLEGD